MYAFSAKVEIPTGATLAGFSDRMHVPTTRPGVLEIHGIGHDDWQICAIDALYAGALMDRGAHAMPRRVFAASHTHYAPMLDSAKPALGQFSQQLAGEYAAAMTSAPRQAVSPDTCTLYAAPVEIPVYRRFDYPPGPVNRLLTRYAGRYPNDQHPVDRNVYILLFSQAGAPQFSILYHACHPVTRHESSVASPDYIGVLREAVAARWGAQPTLFFLGCAGDIRPNLSQKRVRWLPRGRLNWKFRPEPTLQDEADIDGQYRRAVKTAAPLARFSITARDLRLTEHRLMVRGLGDVSAPCLDIGDELSFSFLPFEVSHRYQLEIAARPCPPHRFIVSCANTVYGYLPHSTQHRYGGYEVESSRVPMGLENPISMQSEDLWPSK